MEGGARALVADAAPRATPFEAFAPGLPFGLRKLSLAEQAKAIRRLIDAVRESKPASPASRRAVQTAVQAVAAVEVSLLAMNKAEAAARMARDTRRALGQVWDRQLAALKRGARAAADEGAPGLYEALFGGLRRSRTKMATSEPVKQPGQPVEPTAAVAAPSTPPVNAA